MNHSYLFLVPALVICSCTFDKEKNAENQPDNSEKNASTLYGDQITSTALLNSFDTTITVLFWETTDSTSETQKKNLQQFINKQDSLFPSILNAIFEEYKQSYSVRAAGMSLGSLTHWFFAALISQTFTFFAESPSIGPTIIFAFFAGMMVLQLLFVWKLMPETKGIALEDMNTRIGH